MVNFLAQFSSLLLLLIAVVAITILVLMFISGIVSNVYGAPYVPIKRRWIGPLLHFGGLACDDVLFDLGCGDGRVILFASKNLGVTKATGFEVALWPFLKSYFLIQTAGNVKIYHRNFFKADLSSATFIYAYLFPKLIDRLAYKLAEELHLGTKILCVSFPINLAVHPEFKLLKSGKIGTITAYLYERI